MEAHDRLRSLRFERLAPRHISQVLEIERCSNPAPWSEKSFENELDHPQGRFIVAILDDDVVAFAAVWLVIDETHVTNVAVAPEVRRMGIGERVMSRVMEMAKTEGMTCATLEVRAGNASAIALYEKLGFSAVAVRKGYYPDNREDAIVMWLYGLQAWEPSRS